MANEISEREQRAQNMGLTIEQHLELDSLSRIMRDFMSARASTTAVSDAYQRFVVLMNIKPSEQNKAICDLWFANIAGVYGSAMIREEQEFQAQAARAAARHNKRTAPTAATTAVKPKRTYTRRQQATDAPAVA